MNVHVDDDDVIALLQGKLRKHPHVRYEASPSHITILPLDATGFGVEVILQPHWYSVRCDGWYGAFANATDAVAFVELALSESARLEVWIRGETAYRWTFQKRQGRGWEPVSGRRSIWAPFWRRRRILYLQNRLLEAA